MTIQLPVMEEENLWQRFLHSKLRTCGNDGSYSPAQLAEIVFILQEKPADHQEIEPIQT